MGAAIKEPPRRKRTAEALSRNLYNLLRVSAGYARGSAFYLAVWPGHIVSLAVPILPPQLGVQLRPAADDSEGDTEDVVIQEGIGAHQDSRQHSESMQA